jgi:hypothetical protein
MLFGITTEWCSASERNRVHLRPDSPSLAHARSKGQKLGRPKVRRDRDQDAKVIRKMRAESESYAEIADALARTKSDIYRVCMTLGCAPGRASTTPMNCCRSQLKP